MRTNLKLFVLAGLLVAVGLAMAVGPFASSAPDGLEKVAAEEGFADAEQDHALADGPLAGYGDDRGETAVSGLVGVLVTFGVGLGAFALVRTLRPRDRTDEPA